MLSFKRNLKVGRQGLVWYLYLYTVISGINLSFCSTLIRPGFLFSRSPHFPTVVTGILARMPTFQTGGRAKAVNHVSVLGGIFLEVHQWFSLKSLDIPKCKGFWRIQVFFNPCTLPPTTISAPAFKEKNHPAYWVNNCALTRHLETSDEN